MNSAKITGAMMLTLSLFATQTFAQEATSGKSTFPTPREATNISEMKPSVGIRMGAADPTDGYESAFEYGAEFAVQPYIPFGMGGELTQYSADRNGTEDLDRTKLLGKGTYNFGGTTPITRHGYVGANAGLVVDTIGKTSYGRFGVGPIAGFDIPLTATGIIDAKALTLGANVSYLFVSDAAADDFGLRGQLKYWF